MRDISRVWGLEIISLSQAPNNFAWDLWKEPWNSCAASVMMTMKGFGDKMPTGGFSQTYHIKMAKRMILPHKDFFSSHF